MPRLTLQLAGVLAAQLVLALVLSLAGSGNASFKAKEPLLAFNAAAIDGIDVDESGANSVSLTKRDGSWSIPSMADFPADGAKVAGLLTKLGGLKKGWPVATSSEAAKRFKVSNEAHERRIVLKSSGKQVAEVLFGTAPSFRQVHARAANDASVYSIAFANYDAATRAEDWMKRDLLAVPEDKVASISIGDVTLERKDGKFTMPGLAEGQKLNETEVARLAGAATHPVFDAVQGKGPEALAKVNEPDIQVSIKRDDGTSIIYKYKKEAAGGAYLFASSAQDYLFRVAEVSIEPIAKAKRTALLVEVKSSADAGAQPAPKAEQPQAAPSGG
jgi:outer membrane lipoprotein SlyB